MSTTTSEPKLLIPALAPFYDAVRDLSYPMIRLAVGGTLLVHGIIKLMGPGFMAFANGSIARRGLEPSVVIAAFVYFNETIGAVCLMLGLFTRFVAASVAIEMAVIAFKVSFPNGYGWVNQGGGWEYPLLWGLVVLAIALRGGGPYSLDRALGKEL